MPLTPVTSAQVNTAINALNPRFHKATVNGDEANATLKQTGNLHKSLKHDNKGYVGQPQYTIFRNGFTAAQGGRAFLALEMGLMDAAFSPASERFTSPASGLANDIIGSARG